MNHYFDDALNDCLERIAEGEDIAECLERYPQYREDLAPLLNTAQLTFHAVSTISYRIEAKQRGMDRMLQAYSEGRMNAGQRWFTLSFLRPLARPILVGFIAVFLTAVAAGGSTMAAADSVPGEPLYWVKKTQENVVLMMPSSDIEKAETHARLASTRTREIDRLIGRNRIREAERMIRRVEYHLNETASYAGIALFDDPYDMPVPQSPHNTSDLRRALERDARILRVLLEDRADHAPNISRVKIIRIRQQSDLSYRIIIHAMDQPNSFNGGPFYRIQPSVSGFR